MNLFEEYDNYLQLFKNKIAELAKENEQLSKQNSTLQQIIDGQQKELNQLKKVEK